MQTKSTPSINLGILLAILLVFVILLPIKKMKPSILIIEDEKIVREGLVRTLSSHYETFQAKNNKEAFEIINDTHDIKVVVSDLKIPEEEGLELLDMIRTADKGIRVIFLTAFSSIETAIDAIRRGAFDYMPKPVDLKKLRTAIKNAIDNTN